MATKTDIRNDVLDELQVVGRGQTANAEDAVDVEAKIDQMHEWLIVKNLAYWGDEITDIPLEALPWFTIIVASALTNKFQVPPIDTTKATDEVRQLGANAISGEPIEANYY